MEEKDEGERLSRDMVDRIRIRRPVFGRCWYVLNFSVDFLTFSVEENWFFPECLYLEWRYDGNLSHECTCTIFVRTVHVC